MDNHVFPLRGSYSPMITLLRLLTRQDTLVCPSSIHYLKCTRFLCSFAHRNDVNQTTQNKEKT